MKKITLLLFGTFSLQCLKAQSASELSVQAEKALISEEYTTSCQLYQQLLQLSKTPNQLYNAACACSLSGDTAIAMNLLTELPNTDFSNLEHLKTDKDLLALHEHTQWNVLLQQLQKSIDEKEKNYNIALKKQLEFIYLKDQTLRQLYQEANEKFGAESAEMNYFWDLIAKDDSLNVLEIVAIIEKYGWPGESLVGKKANTALWLVIQHADLSIQEKYLPLLKASVKAGESKGSHLATLEDRILVRKGKEQLYGTQLSFDSKTGTYSLDPLFEPEYVNQRRALIGLGPIEAYLATRGIEWNIPQKIK